MEEDMFVLVVNCGSSSLKADVLQTDNGARLAALRVERLGGAGPATVTFAGQEPTNQALASHDEALRGLLPDLLGSLPEGQSIQGVGHRVVHGGDLYSTPVRIDEKVEQTIEELSLLAPLHNPANLAGIRAARSLLANVPHVAVFDTAFHASLPRRARTYAIPSELAKRHKLKRFGFHGSSHEFVAKQAAGFLESDIRTLRIITCHLGNGCSVAAIENGRSVETSMGMTPLEGLVMGTRCGDLDPGLIVHLMRSEGLDVDGVDALLNRQSGLAGLSGVGRDMRDIEERAASGDEACRLAIQVFAHRVRKYIGAYAAVMGGVDAVVFTGGIGQNSALIRHRIAQRLDFLGARLDEDKNRDGRAGRTSPVVELSTSRSRVALLAVETDEAWAIGEHTAKLVRDQDQIERPSTIPIAVSARHIHLTVEAVATLFGAGHELTPRNPLSQPGQFACEETLDLVGPKRTIERVRVLGPVRRKNQIEISRTDEFFLGIDAPVRKSGDVEHTPGIVLRGPKGTLTVTEGVICAWRHIHMTTSDAAAFGVAQGDIVEVAVNSGPRELIFGDVMIRVSDKYSLEMHIDTDEANAAELNSGDEGMLKPAPGQATLLRRRTRYDVS